MPETARGSGNRLPGWIKAIYSRSLIGLLSILAGVVLWQIVSGYVRPLFLPSPLLTWESAEAMWHDGLLWSSVLASSGRILSGWGLGVIVGVPTGVLMGYVPWIRQALDPYISFFRFIPPISFVTLAIIWLGPGELSKVALIFYTTVFIVTVNAIAGVQAVAEIRLRAAASLGAKPMRILLTVIVPSTVPYMLTGARIAMGNSFLTVVSAEMISARTGLGSMIWTARNYGRTEWVFVGIILLGVTGYVFDFIIRSVSKRLLRRYAVAV